MDREEDVTESKTIAFLILFQLMAVFFGFFALGIVLKVLGYPQQFPAYRWDPHAVWMRENGLWLLIVPLIWGIVALILQHSRAMTFVGQSAFGLGVLIIFGVLAAFLIPCCHPGKHTMYVYGVQSKTPAKTASKEPGYRTSQR